MDFILFNAQAYGRLINVLLILLVLFYFIPLRKQHKSFSNISFYLVGAFFFHAGYLFTFSVNHPIGMIGTCFAIMAPIGMAFMLQFAYDFPVENFRKEKKIVFIVSLILCAAAVLEYWVGVYLSGIRLSATGYVSLHTSKLAPPVAILIHLMTVFVLYRQSKFVKENFDKQQDFRGPLTFANLILIEFFTSFIVYAYLYYIRPNFFIHAIINITTFIVLAGYTIVLLKYSRKFISMTYKLVGLSITITLLAFTLFGYFFLQEKLSSYEKNAQLSFVNSMKNPTSETLLKVKYIYDITHANFIAGSDQPSDSIYYYMLAEKPTPYAVDKFIYADGPKTYVQFLLFYENRWFLAGFDEQQYRQMTHDTTLKLLYLLVGFLSLLALLFPLLVNNGILHPVRNLVESMQSIISIENKMPFHRRDSELELLSSSMHLLENSMKDYQTLQSRYKELEGKPSKQKRPGNVDIHSPAIIEKVKKVKKFIDANYHYDISREGLASSVNMSVSSLGKAFKFKNKQTIREYLNGLRIEKSCKQLQETEEPIINIAYQVGFESLRTFNRAFRKVKSCSPTEFRSLYQQSSSD